MPDNLCKWKSKYFLGYECHEPPLDGDGKGWCILHSEREDKDEGGNFEKKVKERLKGKEEIDLMGCCFPKGFRADYFERYAFAIPVDFSEATFLQWVYFSEATFSKADFSRATFSQEVYFSGATFSEEADFSGVTFSQEANFSEAKFSQANFFRATFSEAADFRGATFSEADFSRAEFEESAVFFKTSFRERAVFGRAVFKGNANFNSTAFKGRTDFEWAEFWGWAFFSRNSRLTYARPEKPLGKIQWPGSVKGKICYDVSFNLLSFEGTMFQDEKDELRGLLEDDSYKKAIDELHDLSQIRTLGTESVFHYARFEGETIRFQEADLSQCSFLHSNIDKVDFRYCEFNKDRPDPLFGIRGLGWLDRIIDHRRQNVLKDEIDADKKDVGTALAGFRERAGASPAPTGKGVREEKYEPVRRLYLELKKNFEDKRDWNTAGDFHYGEMECREKMHGWSTFEGILVNIYFWSSGYGERPLRASVILCIFVLFLFPLLLVGNDCWPYISGSQSFCFWNCVWAFYDSVKDSFRLATFTTVTKIGEQIKPDTGWDNVFLVLESIIVYVQILLLALALRRKVKR